MKALENFLNRFLGPIANWMSESLFFSSMAEAFMRTTPITIGAAVLMVIGNFPIPSWIAFMQETGMSVHFDAVIGASTNAISLYIAFIFAYVYAKKAGQNGLSAGLISLASFLILIPQKINITKVLVNKAYVAPEMYEGIMAGLQPLIDAGVFTGTSGFTDFFTSGTGIFVALIVASITAILFVKLNERNFTIKLPESVPANVSESLSPSLIAGVIFIIFFAVRVGLSYTPFGNMFHLVFGLIQQPLQGFAATAPAMIIMFTICNLCWFFGIHPNMIYAIMMPLLAGIRPEMIAAFQDGVNPMPYIAVTIVGMAAGNAFGGQGGTYGWVVSSFTAKSEQYKSLRKLAAVPAIFNINEPLVFGAPIMMNPIYFIPLVAGPAVMGGVALLVAKLVNFGVVNPTAEMPWTMPGIVKAFMTGGWQYGVVTIAIIAVNIALWFPFFKIADNKLFEEEQALQNQQ
ncbi:PTS sugar transporter subunit IIC [Erysipelothrix sp. HDW6C]|uniref:PTS sugar transporter subunit IIC n=1 Tax=Erysipelothrix sp. HDW6C TaxID=2714930 RepID=UPI001408438D|nr:PTS transporter subunit EIIC [Erysipelothrix sp. HDW6C]QIK68915.1 PTS sugar transporter subunit IIC [Erysipelothrix sp. HDW6C]